MSAFRRHCRKADHLLSATCRRDIAGKIGAARRSSLRLCRHFKLMNCCDELDRRSLIITDRAQSMIKASRELEAQLAVLHQRAEKLSSLLRIFEAQSVAVSGTGSRGRGSVTKWVQKNIGPVAATVLVFAFCMGFVMASYVYIS